MCNAKQSECSSGLHLWCSCGFRVYSERHLKAPCCKTCCFLRLMFTAGAASIAGKLCSIQKSARNVEFLEVNYASAVRVYDVLRADRIVVEEAALEYIQEFYA